MRYDFTGKVVAITGASGKSIGVKIAEDFLHAGACIAVCSRSIERVREAMDKISDDTNRDRILMLQADLSDVEQCRYFINETVRHFGRIDVLINNAAVQYKESAMDTTQESWDATMNANLRGCFFTLQTAAEDMIRRGEGGSIINISSAHSQMALENRISYAVAKAGLNQMTKSAARELGPEGIRINALAIGSFPTGMSRTILAENDIVSPRLPLRRRGRLEEVSSVCMFLASEDSSYMTGDIINVDGGFLLSMS